MDGYSAGAVPAQVVTLVVLWGLILALVALCHRPTASAVRAPVKEARPLKPKTGDDCPWCQGQLTPKMEEAARRTPRPWGEVRSPRGPKKHSETEGYACDNVACEYHGITDAIIHGLIAFGGHGKHEWI
jgi:hypothetical protein